MSPNNCPCNGCTERFIACSDKCPKDARGEYGYKAWKAYLHKVKAAEKEYIKRWREDFLMSEQCESSKEKWRLGKKNGKQ